MSFENFDKKIKDSLEQVSHVYDESSWHKMETMLEEHMPQKKDNRRRLFIFIFMFLLLGGGSVLFFNNIYSEKKSNVTANKLPETQSQLKQEAINSSDKLENPETGLLKIPETTNRNYSTANSQVNSNKIVIKEKNPRVITGKPAPVIAEHNTIVKSGKTKSAEIIEQENKLNNQQETDTAIDFNQTETENNEISFEKETNEEVKEKLPVVTKNISGKKKRSALNNIQINLSVASDISSVGNNTGSLKLLTGAGLGYRITDRLTIRTGLFAGRKVYTTVPEDYNPPPSFWIYYPNLKHIDADCKILEIPLNLDYNFAFSKSANWFISAGVSSFIMKKEEYNYYYKPTNSQQYVYYKRSYENKNKHYFSILNLSAGYSRKISSVLTLQAEPYFKIALKGVGYGKVKLNSTGILFTASFKPFQTNK